ncbi:hypothetical protein JCM5350_008283 [Sporobolomyces pararoseus]
MSSETIEGGNEPSSTSSRITLLDLPNETLTDIFKHIYWWECIGPICKRLVPFVREHLYRQIYLRTRDDLILLMKTLSNVPECRVFVKAVTMSDQCEVDVCEREGDEEFEESWSKKDRPCCNRLLRSFFSLVPWVVVKSYKMFWTIAVDEVRYFMEDPQMGLDLRSRIQAIELNMIDEMEVNPFSPLALSELQHFPNLRSLEITDFEESCIPPSPHSIPFLSSATLPLTRLDIEFARQSYSCESLALFLPRLPHLKHLELYDSLKPETVVALEALPNILFAAPQTLEILRVRLPSDSYPPPPYLAAAIFHLSSLRYLSIENCNNFDQTFFDSLPRELPGIEVLEISNVSRLVEREVLDRMLDRLQRSGGGKFQLFDDPTWVFDTGAAYR